MFSLRVEVERKVSKLAKCSYAALLIPLAQNCEEDVDINKRSRRRVETLQGVRSISTGVSTRCDITLHFRVHSMGSGPPQFIDFFKNAIPCKRSAL